MMRVLILGGTGSAGILLIRESLAHSHTVVVYARSPQKLPDDITNNPQVVIVKGDFSDEEALSGALEGVDAVISALGPPVTKGPFQPGGNPIAHVYARVVDVMHKKNVKRLVVLGTASITDPHDKFDVGTHLRIACVMLTGIQYKFWTLVAGVMLGARGAYNDMLAIGETIRGPGNDLEWTIVRVPILTNQESKDVIAGYVGDGKMTIWVSRAAFAFFVVEELDKNEWVKKAPLISSP
jgi:NAD(P)-dependent dehydrogenase (short-subunit alcohol dehydrogenase family)